MVDKDLIAAFHEVALQVYEEGKRTQVTAARGICRKSAETVGCRRPNLG